MNIKKCVDSKKRSANFGYSSYRTDIFLEQTVKIVTTMFNIEFQSHSFYL
jgi:hypothetical protein